MLAPDNNTCLEQAVVNSPKVSQNHTAQAIEIAIRLSLIFLILAWCLQILTPFISIIAWGAIIAIAIHTPYLKLVEKLGGRKKLAVMLIAVVGIAIVLVPVISLSSSMIDGSTKLDWSFCGAPEGRDEKASSADRYMGSS